MALGNRYSQHSFAQIPDVHIPRSQVDRSFPLKDTFDFDYLIPIYVDEIVPGDTFNLTVRSFARLSTQLVPVMDNMYLDYFFFFVPNRLTYDKWEQLNGAQANPDDTTDYIMPQLTTTAGGPEVGTIFDKMGLPTDIAAGYLVKNTLPLRCYGLIWNEWFRDQNLQDSVVVPTDEGPDAMSDFTLLKRGKRHDYFTSCLPWPQKGPAVELPLGTSAPITGQGTIVNTEARMFVNDGGTWKQTQFGGSNSMPFTYNLTSGSSTINGGVFVTAGTMGSNAGGTGTSNTRIELPSALVNPGSFTADLTDATAATINQFREAIMMQSLFELDARGGTRYVEILRTHFGVISPDFRLQRPEFLGGGSVPINVHPVAQTSASEVGKPQGNLAAFATASTTSRDNIGFTKSFVEHGYVIGLVCARADITYQQGLNRMWSKSTRYDFFWPKLQQLGEQAVLNNEIYVQGTSADTEVFGYQERYGEYKYYPGQIHGEFRSTYATSLDVWHLAQEFGSLPVLNDEFIEQNTPIDRALAVTSQSNILFDCWFDLKCARPMMTYAVPATLGRF